VNAAGISGCGLTGNTLDVAFGLDVFQQLWIHIEGFSGPGTYSTDKLGKILVGMQGGTPDNPGGAGTTENRGGIADDGSGTWETPYPARDYPCTIQVQTNLLQMTRDPSGAVPFGIAFDVTCPVMGTSANFPYDCQVSPAAFHASVAACSASGG
jgi:hypothetical protein